MCKQTVSGNDQATQQVAEWLAKFASALESRDMLSLKQMFAPECYWRDIVAFTWNIKTLEGRDAISDMVLEVVGQIMPHKWAVKGSAEEVNGVIEAWITFETASARCVGQVRLRSEGCWTFFTAAQELKGHEERRGRLREQGGHYGAVRCRESWAKRRRRERAELGHMVQPYVVIIGGGQAGITLGARLKHLGVTAVILERSERAGDIWRHRYDSLCLHDPVWVCHLPYMPFPENFPMYPSKDQLADWLEMYVRVMDLNYWTKSTCSSAAWNQEEGDWCVTVQRDGENVLLKPKHVVMATGNYGLPHIPDFPRMDMFRNDVRHSSKYTGGADFIGKKAVVIGSNTSAHDICQDLWEHGADVTMVQRSSTLVVSTTALREILLKPLYSEEALAAGITTDSADLKFATLPYKVLTEMHKQARVQMEEHDADILQRLKDVGFLLDSGDDGSGAFMKYIRRGSGYYFDIGASELIADGSVKLKVDQVASFSEKGVITADGTELPADLVVLATGYGSAMTGVATQIMGTAVMDKVGKVWGLGSETIGDPGPWEGELRNMWKPTKQEGLWIHGGNLLQNRYYSQYLALQLKARELGLPTPVYGV